MPYQPIEHSGVIGNMRTAALVGQDGSLDRLCLPRFDAPGVFGAPRRLEGRALPHRCPGTDEAENRLRETVAFEQKWGSQCLPR